MSSLVSVRGLCAGIIADVLDNVGGQHEIERFVLKWQSVDVALLNGPC
jgi:hypothetical protein